MKLPVRSGLLKNKEGDEVVSDAPSLLFFYIFDDWYTSYSLVARKEHQYGKQLGRLVSETYNPRSLAAYTGTA